jgi:hypothetical protein
MPWRIARHCPPQSQLELRSGRIKGASTFKARRDIRRAW